MVDYLNALPIEIWREIFLHVAPLHTIPVNTFKPPILIKFKTDLSKSLIKVQHTRLRLLTICKSLSPLIERLLYTEVILYGNLRVQRFIDSSSRKQAKDPNRSEWTKSVYILSLSNEPSLRKQELLEKKAPTKFRCAGVVKLAKRRSQGTKSSLATTKTTPPEPCLFSICPRLAYLRLDLRSGVQYPTILRLIGREAKSIKVITIHPYLNLFDLLQALPTDIPLLEQLNIYINSYQVQETHKPITFPSVHTVSIRQYLDINQMLLSFPSLRHLSLGIPNADKVDTFIRSYCPNIVELVLTSWSMSSPDGMFFLPNNLFHACPRLKKFTFDASYFRTPQIPMTPPHNKLQELVLSMHTPITKSNNTEDKAKYFSKTSFPNLRSITFHFRAFIGTMAIPNFNRTASHLFPFELKFDIEDAYHC